MDREWNLDDNTKCFVKGYICAILIVMSAVGGYIFGSIGIQF